MTVPAAFESAIAARQQRHFRWLEIEGLPYAYGTAAQNAVWFASRPAGHQLLGIRPYLTQLPANEDAELDVLDGLAKTVGSIEFRVGDHDGLPTVWAGVHNDSDWVFLAADISAAAVALTYDGDGSGLPASGTIYIGTETITYTGHNTGTKTLTGLTRGKYRSTAKAHGAGMPVAIRPYTMRGRRCWYYQCVSENGTWDDDDKATRFVGTMEKYRLDPETMGAFIISVESLEREMTRRVFRELRTIFDEKHVGISDAQGVEPGLKATTQPGWGSEEDSDLTVPDAAKFAGETEPIFVRIEDEVLSFEYVAATGALRLYQRGCFGTQTVAHEPGWTGQEVVAIANYDATSSHPEETDTRFRSQPTNASPARNNHPLSLLLQVMLSTGRGTNYNIGQRNYDVLPEGWGLAIDVSRVDVAGIEEMAAIHPEVVFGGVIESEMGFVDFAKRCLAPFGYFGITQLGDTWTVRAQRPPLPDQFTRVIDDSKRIVTGKSRWDGNYGGVVSEVVLKCDWDIVKREYRRVEVLKLSEADIFTQADPNNLQFPGGRTITYEVPWLYSGASVPGAPPQKGVDVAEFVKSRAAFFRLRFGRPPPVISEMVDYSFLDAELGELVALTHSHLPNSATGGRGLNGAIGEIISKRVDDRAKVIDLDLLMTGYQVGDYRFVSPSLSVTAWDSGALEATVAANAFTESSGGQSDLAVADSLGDLQPTFTEGQPVTVYTEDFGQSYATTVDTLSGNVVRLGDDPGFTPAFIVFRQFPQTNSFDASLVTTYAFLADANLLLNVSQKGHRYFP